MSSGLWLYCRDGQRITHEDLRQQINASQPDLISHDFGPVTPINRAARSIRPALELLLGGFTFDLYIVAVPSGHMHREYINVLESGEAGFQQSVCALVIVPGPHLAGSDAMLMIVRAQWHLGARLAAILPHIAGSGWGPSATVRSAPAFIAAVEAWGRGGAIPSPGLITFLPVIDHALQSTGLSHFTGQEVRLEPELAVNGDHGKRLGQQIAHMLIHRGQLTAAEEFIGPGGEPLRLEPSANSRFVRVWRG